ncbi:DUF3080 family protein [Hahella ganghwensis]|uniref:DUF3080 family protein n=1 Tax=Hahella ganghwensis TaxID=286420 RepID=UPI00037DFEA5|nr:DUF3080 family protein [Hahella ganghwensis]
MYALLRVLLLVGLLPIAACENGDTLQGRMLDYQERLERVLETEFTEVDTTFPEVRYPLPKQLRRETTSFTINWLDFFSIISCDLNRLIGERNSSLGKVMSASQHWRYEQEFLIVGQQCLEQLEKDQAKSDLKKELAEILRTKRSEIMNVAWNATWAGPEFQELMSFHDGPLPIDFHYADWSELSSALGQLSVWSGQPAQIESSKTHEKMNLTLISYPIIGRLILSINESRLLMENINQGLREAIDGRPICFNSTPNPKSRILSNILTNVFVQNVQPQLSELSKAMEHWRSLLEHSYVALAGDVDAPFYQLYLTDESLIREFKDTMAEHGALWTELLAQCGLRPGSLPD